MPLAGNRSDSVSDNALADTADPDQDMVVQNVFLRLSAAGRPSGS